MSQSSLVECGRHSEVVILPCKEPIHCKPPLIALNAKWVHSQNENVPNQSVTEVCRQRSMNTITHILMCNTGQKVSQTPSNPKMAESTPVEIVQDDAPR